MTRFVERAENLARILEVNETFSRDSQGVQNWLSIVQLNADGEVFATKHATATAENVLRFYLTDAENPTSIVATISTARENARILRPLVSTEMWVQLNVFHNRLKAVSADELTPGNVSPLLNRIKEACQTFAGIAEGTLYRDQAWYFYRLGRYVERADQTTRLLDTKYHLLGGAHGAVNPGEVGQWHALLRSASGYHAFRRIHSGDVTAAGVAEFLLFNRSFPRSVLFCLREVESAFSELKLHYAIRRGNEVAERLDALRGMLSEVLLEDILRGGLHDFIDFLQVQFIAISERLSETFFGHPPRESSQEQMQSWPRQETAPAMSQSAAFRMPISGT